MRLRELAVLGALNLVCYAEPELTARQIAERLDGTTPEIDMRGQAWFRDLAWRPSPREVAKVCHDLSDRVEPLVDVDVEAKPHRYELTRAGLEALAR